MSRHAASVFFFTLGLGMYDHIYLSANQKNKNKAKNAFWEVTDLNFWETQGLAPLSSG